MRECTDKKHERFNLLLKCDDGIWRVIYKRVGPRQAGEALAANKALRYYRVR